MMQMVSVPVTFVIPILAGRMKDQRMLTAITCTCLIMGYAFLLSGISSLVTIGVVLAGIGGELHLAWLRCSFVLRTADARQAAGLSGMAQSFGYILAAGGPLLFGLIHDWTHGWTLPLLLQVALAIVLLITGIMASKNRLIGDS